jgi:hypothetical protein
MNAQRLLRPAIWSYALQRFCTWYPLRRPLAALVAATKPGASGTASAHSKLILTDLRRDGIAHLPAFVGGDSIARIRRHLEGASLRERFPPFREKFAFDAIPENVHVAEYSTAHILRSPDVLQLANHPDLLEVAGGYLGCKPTISNISIWWSLPADGTAQEAENYHRDVDDWRFVKFFLYLTEVDQDAGPHCFVRGSHRKGRFLRLRRFTDDEVAGAFADEDILKITGKPGDAFLEDTFGLHKGQPPQRSRRLLFQVEYSVSPIAVYSYEPTQLGSAAIVDPYVNRLFVTPGPAA